MATLNTIVAIYASDLKNDPESWVVVWKTGKRWNALSVWRDPETAEFKLRDLIEMRNALEQDNNAIILNGLFCGIPKRGISVKELSDLIRRKYSSGANPLSDVIEE